MWCRPLTRRKSLITLAAIAAAVVALDALAKAWAVAVLTPVDGKAVRIDAGPLDFVLVHNTGAAFGIGADATWVFIVVTVVIVAAALAWIGTGRRRSPLAVVSLSLLVGGGIGNFIDRVALGYVVDFIEFSFVDFPVFNIADICITAGVVLLLVWGFFFSGREDEVALAAGRAGACGKGEACGKDGDKSAEAGGKSAEAGGKSAGNAGGAEGAAGGKGAAAGKGGGNAASAGKRDVS